VSLPLLVPLHQWHMENFKSVEEATIDLAPLTVIVGANSSGKSSLLQSILLAVQTAQGTSLGIVEGDRIPLNGSLVSLGSYPDVLSLGSRGPVTLGGTYVPDSGSAMLARNVSRHAPPRSRLGRTADAITWKLSFKGAPENEPGASLIHAIELDVLAAEDESDERHVVAVFKSRRRSRRTAEANPMPVVTSRRSRLPAQRAFQSFVGSVKLAGHAPRRTHGVSLSSNLPVSFLTTRNESAVVIDRWLEWLNSPASYLAAQRRMEEGQSRRGRESPDRRSPSDEELVELLMETAVKVVQTVRTKRLLAEELEPYEQRRRLHVMFRDLWPEVSLLAPHQRRMAPEMAEVLERHVRRSIGPGDKLLIEDDDLIEPIAGASLQLEGFLATQVKYLGPLRQDPQAIYPPGPSPATGFLGTKGEYTAGVLHAQGSRDVICPLRDGSAVLRPLRDAVSYWLTELRVGASLDTHSHGRLGIELSLREENLPRALSLMSVGVGVSQLVPVVVICLLAPPGSLLLLEQPELHMHPALQQRLGDFLLAIARTGRQLIVETHSEHIVARLRLRIAQDRSDEVIRAVKLVQAWRDSTGKTTYEGVATNAYGGLDAWPPGFFDQTAHESQEILRAALVKKEHRKAPGSA